VKVPKPVNFDEVGVITGQDEVRILFEKKIGDVVEMDKPVERGRLDAVLPAKFITEQAGGFIDVVDKGRIFWRGFSHVMVNDEPIGFVEARLEGEVGDPSGLFARVSLFPVIIVVGLERGIGIEKLASQAFQEDAGNKSIDIALMGNDDVRPWQRIAHFGKASGLRSI